MHTSIPDQLHTLVLSLTGIRRPLGGTERIDAVVCARLKVCGLSSAEQYTRVLRAGDSKSQAEVQELRIGLTNGETHFFRDKGQFALIENSLLPALIQKKAASGPLRIWSAACATGEEAHSIAIVLHSLVQNRPGLDFEIFGTDINEQALHRARAGCYSSWSFRGVSCERKAASFREESGQWKLRTELAKAVRFSRLDLIQDDFPSRASDICDIDLILCRNTFIYFEPRMIQGVIRKMTAALRPGGYLLTGHGELQGQELCGLQVLNFPESCVYQKSCETTWKAPQNTVPLPTFSETFPAESPTKLRAAAKPQNYEQLARDAANEGKYQAAEEWCQRGLRENPFATGVYYLLAKLAEEQKQMERAKEMLKKALYVDPKFVSAYVDLAALYSGENDSARACKLRMTALHCLGQMKPEDRVETYDTTVAEMTAALEGLIRREASQ